MSVESRVARGVALLDRKSPGWDDRVVLRRLNVDDSTRCVLGELYGTYDYGTFRLHLGGHQAARHGFQSMLFGQRRRDRDFAALTREWRNVIKGRRAVRAAMQERERELVDA